MNHDESYHVHIVVVVEYQADHQIQDEMDDHSYRLIENERHLFVLFLVHFQDYQIL